MFTLGFGQIVDQRGTNLGSILHFLDEVVLFITQIWGLAMTFSFGRIVFLVPDALA